MSICENLVKSIKNCPDSLQAEVQNFIEFLKWKENHGSYPIYLDYPVFPSPRYGFGEKPHQLLYNILSGKRAFYGDVIRKLTHYKEGLSRISLEEPSELGEPFWHNGFVEELDAATLFSFPCIYGSKFYIEIGSGNSTKFVRRAIKEYGLNTKIISIDPHPRAEIDGICDVIIRKPLESIDLAIFDDLNKDDILMIDDSHRCFQNSDVTVVFLEVLPHLKSGVIVYMDDIFLPYDYPPEWAERYYSEQYLLATLLLADSGRYDVVFPCTFIAHDQELKEIVRAFWQEIGLQSVKGCGNGLWIRVN